MSQIEQRSVEGRSFDEISGRHRIQGIGAGFAPALLDRALRRQVQQSHDEEALAMAP